MDLATPIGLVVALAAVIGSYVMEGGNPMVLIAPSAIVLVFLGTFGVAFASNKLSDLGGIFKAALKVLLPGKKLDTQGMVGELMGYADTARREGLLALEDKVKAVEDPFLRRGLMLVVDGTDSKEVEEVLFSELLALRERHKIAAKFFADMGGFAPTLGIIGTVMGLVHALEGLSDPAKLGHAISAAFLATLWGVITANVIWLPLSNKLKRNAADEMHHRETLLQGILGIQAGASPRALGELLKSNLAPAQRDGVGAKKEQKSA